MLMVAMVGFAVELELELVLIDQVEPMELEVVHMAVMVEEEETTLVAMVDMAAVVLVVTVESRQPQDTRPATVGVMVEDTIWAVVVAMGDLVRAMEHMVAELALLTAMVVVAASMLGMGVEAMVAVVVKVLFMGVEAVMVAVVLVAVEVDTILMEGR